jgi:hypothetical protein
MPLTKQQEELLSIMRKDNKAAGFPFTHGSWWKYVDSCFDTHFRDYGIGDVESQIYNASFSTWPDSDSPAYIHFACHLLKSSIEARNDWILTRAPSSGLATASCPTHNGVVSWDQLMSCHTLIEIDSHVPVLTEPMTVLDLGAGWGRIGHSLCQANPEARYIICDLPESLLIAYVYLHRLLPSICHPYGVLLDEPGIYFLGSQGIMLPPDKSIDVVVNIASFQEMPKEQVVRYLALIKQKAHWLYTLQRGFDMPSVSLKEWTEVFRKNVAWYDTYEEALYSCNGERR